MLGILFFHDRTASRALVWVRSRGSVFVGGRESLTGRESISKCRRVLQLILAASVSYWMSTEAAAATSSRGSAYRNHPHAAGVSFRNVLHHRATHIRHASIRLRGRYVKAHVKMAVHTDVVALTNTTWDHPTASPVVLDAILEAAWATGVDPNLLSTLAWRESRYDSAARNRRSSASGLLQFTSGTWLQTIHDFGGQHGAAAYAAEIHQETSGRIVVHGRYTRAAILKLRDDPVLSVMMAAEVMRRQDLASGTSLRRNATSTDLYLLHVLGPSGSARFLHALAHSPSVPSVAVVRPGLLRNAGLLARDGRPMTVAGTYAAIGIMLDGPHAQVLSPPTADEAGAWDGMVRLIETAQLAPHDARWCNTSDLIVCSREAALVPSGTDSVR